MPGMRCSRSASCRIVAWRHGRVVAGANRGRGVVEPELAVGQSHDGLEIEVDPGSRRWPRTESRSMAWPEAGSAGPRPARARRRRLHRRRRRLRFEQNIRPFARYTTISPADGVHRRRLINSIIIAGRLVAKLGRASTLPSPPQELPSRKISSLSRVLEFEAAAKARETPAVCSPSKGH